MKTVNTHEAKTHFSKLLKRVSRGEEILIANRGVPVARLLPITSPPTRRAVGKYQGQIVIADDFDAPLREEVLAAFEGRLADSGSE